MKRLLKQAVRGADAKLFGGRGLAFWRRAFILGGDWHGFLAAAREKGLSKPGSWVLDAGAGQCELREVLSGCRYIAVDLGVGTDDPLRPWDFSGLDVIGDVQRLPFRDEVFELVISKQVLEHLPHPAEAIADAGRVLAPGGELFLSTNLIWQEHQQPYDFFRFTQFALRHIVEQAGLEVIEMRPMGGYFSVLRHVANSVHLPPRLNANPLARSAMAIVRVLWRPVDLLAAPFAYLLDRMDPNPSFTLGYFVRARRARAGCGLVQAEPDPLSDEQVAAVRGPAIAR